MAPLSTTKIQRKQYYTHSLCLENGSALPRGIDPRVYKRGERSKIDCLLAIAFQNQQFTSYVAPKSTVY